MSLFVIILESLSIPNEDLEGQTNISECIFDALSTFPRPNPVLTPLKSASKTHSENVSSIPKNKTSQNHLAKFTHPKRRFWKVEATFQNAFPNDCSAFQNLRSGSIILLQRKQRWLLCFVNPSLQFCYKGHVIRPSDDHHATVIVVFCKAILAILLQRKHQTTIHVCCVL